MFKSRHVAGLLGMGTLLAYTAGAQAPTQAATQEVPSLALEEVIVTGSRVIANGNDSPTPVTVVTMEDLQASRPTTVFEGLQELPIFAGGGGGAVGGRTGQGGNNNSIASLNPRGLGSVRGLVLFNNHRVPPQNLNGQVDLNQIPQIVLQRVDVQTGGSSAVYGSDAMTGVVNFVVDRNLNGVRFNGQYGLSDQGDGRSNEVAAAFGTDMFGGRGHFIGSFQSHYDAGLLRSDREWVQAPGGYQWSLQGSGTAASPYFTTRSAVSSKITYGGVIVCPSGGAPTPNSCLTRPLVGQNFSSNGALTPFVNGTPVPGSSTTQLGGDGAGGQKTTLKVPVKFQQAYGRFDFDLTDNLHYFIESYFTKEDQHSELSNSSSGATANTSLTNGFIMSTSNAFLTSAQSSALAAGGTTFNVGKSWSTDYYPANNFDFDNKNTYVNTGLEGSFGTGYKWEVSGTWAKADQLNVANNTWDTGRLFAALDSVSVNGTPTCWVNTQPQFTNLYPGCVPMNIFGPTATSAAAIAYVQRPTKYQGITQTKDVEGYINGTPFSTWAGDVTMALSGEWRKLNYKLISEGPSANIQAVDCTGLRYNCVPQSATNIGTAIFPNGTADLLPVSQTVREAALEAEIPVLADKPFAQRVALNPAFRRADYSSTGTSAREIPVKTTKFQANTWKLGLNWQFNDELTLRATRSRDFRAPNMSELYLPGRVQAFTAPQDYLTGVTNVAGQQEQGGNPNLRPEVGYTTTVGVVFKPTHDFSLAVDLFDISITDAITGVNGSDANFQNACYDSGGASIFCTLQRRPLGFSRTAANQVSANNATYWITQTALNLAQIRTQGVDVEANWALELFAHPVQLRALASYQPHIWQMQVFTPTDDAGGVSSPRVRTLASAKIGLTDNLSLNWSTRWRSALQNVSPRLLVAGAPVVVAPGSNRVASAAYSNLTLTYKVQQVTKGDLDVYLNVLNVFDKVPPTYVPLSGTNTFSATPGSGGVGFYPSDDGIGRYFNLGFRYRM